MAYDVLTLLLKIIEQKLLHPKLLSILDGGMIMLLFEMIVSLSDKLRFLKAVPEEYPEEYKTKKFGTWDLNLDEVVIARTKSYKLQLESKLKQVYLEANTGEYGVKAREELLRTLKIMVIDIEDIIEVVAPGEMKKRTASSVVRSSTNYFEEEKNIMVRGTSQNASEPEDEVLVGFKRDVKMITYRLACSHFISTFALSRYRNIDNFLKSVKNPLSKLEVIPLVGEGGIGKSTLAKRVYEHPIIIANFHIRAWVVVSQVHNLKEMLIGLLRCISPTTGEIYNKDNAQIAEQLSKSLMGQKYLIFLDDIWTTIAWDAIRGCLPDNSNGSRILVTTRFIGVAEYLSADPYYMIYQTLEDRWELFSGKVFGQSHSVPREYEFIGKRIVLGCSGLPLGVLVIAGILATVRESIEIWRDVLETLEGMDRQESRISDILSLGYNYLPSHLKACFHYFGVFPEDNDIPVQKLINLWIAEGFLKPHNNTSLEEVAESCLNDLINRSLVQINEQSIDGKIKSCKIHDRLHEVCVREAKKENIVCIINDNCAPEPSCWLSCQASHWPITQACYGNSTPDKIRSILCFGKDVYLSKCRLVYPCLKLLRVLDLSFIKYSHGMPSGITDLIHLRYLALSTIGSPNRLPFFKLQNLLTLTVTSWMEKCPLQLPSDILGLPQLRHLRVDKRCSQYLPCLAQNNLQTLYWLKVASSDQKPNFRMVPNLKELGIYIEGQLVPCYLESLVYLHQLEKLKFEIGRVERFYLPTGFPPNLKKLTLRYTYLPWKEMDIIGKLPHLEVLKVKDFAFCGSEWEPTESNFPGLKVLLISRSDIKHWNASADHFPVLERLVLRYCWELERVPFDFANIGTLKLIELESCYSSLVISAYKIEQKLRMEDRKLHVRDLGTKVGLPINEWLEEGSAELPNNEWREEESIVELQNNEWSESDNCSFKLSHYLSDEERIRTAKKKVLKKTLKKVSKALKNSVLKALKKKVMKALRRKLLWNSRKPSENDQNSPR